MPQDDDGRPNVRTRPEEKEARPIWLTTTEPVIICGCTPEVERGCWGRLPYVLVDVTQRDRTNLITQMLKGAQTVGIVHHCPQLIQRGTQ